MFALTGYTPEEHCADPELGRRVVHPDDLPALEATLAAPEGWSTLTLRWRHRSGRVFATEQRLTVVRDADAKAVALEGVGRPLRAARQRLQLYAGDLVLDLAAQRVLIGSRVVELAPAEHRILVLLAASHGPVSIEAIVTRLWGAAHPGGDRTVQVHVSNLRRRLERDPGRPRRLLTVRGVGYAPARRPADPTAADVLPPARAPEARGE